MENRIVKREKQWIISWSNLAIRFLSIASEIFRFFPISKNLSRKIYRFNQPIFVSRTRLVTSFNDLIVVSFAKKKKRKKNVSEARNEHLKKKEKDTNRLLTTKKNLIGLQTYPKPVSLRVHQARGHFRRYSASSNMSSSDV